MMLLNECLKEDSEAGKLERAMAEQKNENEEMRAMLKEQAAQIQKVIAQSQVSERSARVAVDAR